MFWYTPIYTFTTSLTPEYYLYLEAQLAKQKLKRIIIAINIIISVRPTTTTTATSTTTTTTMNNMIQYIAKRLEN